MYTVMAASNGHLSTLKWLHERRFSWDATTLSDAFKYAEKTNIWKVLEYAVFNNCEGVQPLGVKFLLKGVKYLKRAKERYGLFLDRKLLGVAENLPEGRQRDELLEYFAYHGLKPFD